jgi:hypothetical protein
MDKIRLLREMASMKNGPYLQQLKKEYADTVERLVLSDDNEFKERQGEARMLRRLINDIEGAREELERAERNRPNHQKRF